MARDPGCDGLLIAVTFCADFVFIRSWCDRSASSVDAVDFAKACGNVGRESGGCGHRVRLVTVGTGDVAWIRIGEIDGAGCVVRAGFCQLRGDVGALRKCRATVVTSQAGVGDF